MLPLFAYGTLRDPEYQRELFGRTYPMSAARVSGFIVVSTGGGYLAATRHTEGIIGGALVELDALGYAIADAWEDRAVYDRVLVDARVTESGLIRAAYLYVRLAASGAPVTDERLADRARADVITDIRSFHASTGFMYRP